MKYRKMEAKEYAREHLKGLWCATLTAMAPDMSIDEPGVRKNLRRWIDDIKVNGIFVGGKRGEYFSMSLDERKRAFELTVEEANGKVDVMASCWDLNLQNTVELLKHAERVGAQYAIVQSPILYFDAGTEETIYQYFQYLCDKVDIAIGLWNNVDHGYIMRPEFIAKLAELPNIVAIKDSVARDQCAELTRLAGDRIVVSAPNEKDWLRNIVELGWQALLSTPDVFLLQMPGDLRIREYTQLAMAGKVEEAKKVSASLDPVRKAFKDSAPKGKWCAHMKYWLELQGLAGGPVRAPMLPLTDAEKAMVGFGQGPVAVSPFQAMQFAAPAANGGKLVFPHLVAGTGPKPMQLVSAEFARELASAERSVVTDGTARVLRDDPLRFYGKTGSAQWLKKGGDPHAWFVGSTGYGTSRSSLSFAVLVLRGGHGGSAAAPMAAKVLKHVAR
jgi:4-hydroxy-tetrahydrodipicolinate synthase